MEGSSVDYSTDYYSYLTDTTNSLSDFSYETIGSSVCQQTEDQLLNLQTEILQQVQKIDTYIVNKEKKPKKSESFIALENLYSLFKQELTLNFNIRRALVQEKKFNEQATIQCASAKNQINIFLAKLSQGSGVRYTSLKQVSSQIAQLIQKKEGEKNLKGSKKENQKLKKELEEINAEIDDIKAQKTVEIAEMQARIDFAEEESNKLRKQLEIIQNNKQNQFELYTNQLRKQQAQCYQELNDTRNKLADSSKEVENLKKELENATKELNQLKEEKIQSEIAQTYKDALQKVQNELTNKRNELRHLKKERNALIRCVNEQKIIHDASVEKIDELQEKLNKIESRYKNMNKQNAIRNQRRINANNDIVEEENRRLQSELRNSYAKVRNLEEENAKLFRDIEGMQNELSNMRQATRFGTNTFSRDEIIDAFNTLRNGLGLDRRSTPERVVQYVLSILKPHNRSPMSSPSQYSSSIETYNDQSSVYSVMSDRPSSVCTNELQAQIDSLQNEVSSLKGELTKFTQ